MTLLEFAIKTAKKAGTFILKKSKKTFKTKEKTRNDFVTEVDVAAENLIIKKILSAYPKHGILAEERSFSNNPEAGDYSKNKYIWLIDPIDGTNNFRRGIPFYCVSIAIFETKSSEKSKNFKYLEGELVAGAVYAPEFDKLYYAEKNKGAFLNGKRIKVSPVTSLERSLMATGFHGKYKEVNIPYFEKVMLNSQGMRRNGSAALDLCNVAEGKFEGYWEFGLKPWDIAAGALIVKEAGGRVTDIYGNMLDLFGKNILATNGKIHKEIVGILKD